MTTITFTRQSVRELRKLYDAAVKSGESEFTFLGHPMVTAYAKYLLEYLEGRGL